MMDNIGIDLNWDFGKIIKNAKILKNRYNLFLVSFYFFKIKERNEYIKKIKMQVYSLKISTRYCDKLWEFLNGDLEYEELVKDSILDKIIQK